MNTAHVFSASAAAVLTAVMAFVPTTEQRVAAQTTQAGKQPETEVTLIGCIQREADYRRANASGKGGPVGTGAGLGNEFVLVNARRATAGAPPTAEDPCASGATGEAYELTGNRERELQGFVGRRVEITGMRKEAKTDESTGKPSGGVDPLRQDLRLFEVNVRSFREVPAGRRSEATQRAEPAAQPVSPAQPAAPESTGQIAQAELPRTASPLPLAGLIGLLSIAGALGVRSLRRR